MGECISAAPNVHAGVILWCHVSNEVSAKCPTFFPNASATSRTLLRRRYHSWKGPLLRISEDRCSQNTLWFWVSEICAFLAVLLFFFEVIEALQPESPSLRWVPSPSCLFISCLNLSKRDFFFGLAYDASNPRALLRSRFSLILLVPIL